MKASVKIFLQSVALLLIMASLIPIKTHAQSQNLIFRNITPDDGLPVTTVTDVTQDAFGYIWIGSWDGVYRYDGSNFEKKSDGGRYVTADQKGGVWIAYDRITNQPGRVAYYDSRTDSLTLFDIQGWEGSFPKITLDESGNIWAASDKGLNHFDAEKGNFEKDSIARADFGHIQLIPHKNGSISFFYLEPNVRWGIGNRSENGMVQYEDFPLDQNNPDPSQPFNASSIPNMIRYLDNGLMLINEFGWAYKENFSSEWTFVKPDQPDILLDQGRAITHKNDLYLEHRNALTKFDVETGRSTTYTHNPLNSQSILPMEQFGGGYLFIDRQEVLWIPSFSYGFSRLNLYESDFGLLRSEDGTPVRDVISAVELDDGSFWIGSRIEENGLLHFNTDGNIIQRYSGPFDSPTGKSVSDELSHPFVWSLADGSDGSIWAGTGSPGPEYGGLNRIRPGSDQITRFKHDPDNEASVYPGNWVFNITEDGSGRIWFRDFNQIAWIDPETEVITRYKHPEELEIGENEPVVLLKAASGDLIVSTQSNSYYRIHHEDLGTEQIDLYVDRNVPTPIYDQDLNGQFWVGNTQRFGQLDSTLTKIEKWFTIDSLNVPISEFTSSQNDEQNNRWIGSDNGLVKFNPNTEKATHYSYERGLQGYSFRGTSYRGPSGKLYFAGNGGINIFDPAQIQGNPHPPEMVFKNMTIDGARVGFGDGQTLTTHVRSDDQVVIQPDISTIAFEFAALHFAGDQSNQYQYMLEGFDSDWQDGGSIGQATYTNLSSGDYTLKIRGSNLDGVWSDGSTSLTFAVLPPWYKTWWAYGFYLIIIVVSIVAANRMQKRRVQQIEREKAREKELEQAKEIEKAYQNLEVAHKDLEQAHSNLKSAQDQLIQQEKLASLGQLTAGIAHEIKNPLNFVNNFSDLSLELVEEVRDEIRDMRRENNRETSNLKGEKGVSIRQPAESGVAERNRGVSDVDHNSDTELILDILDDIEANLKTIHKHGTRADSIVKSMLQHSRGGDGKKEPIPLNPIIKEYVNLAFHGMKASEEPINVEIDLQLDEGVGEVPLVAEDFRRVILNLVNNAFDAMQGAGHKAQGAGDCESKLTVRTRSENGSVIIEIEDNGPGIPDDIKDKILQPFFTTKKGTQGTGLGLSITNDIIKAHGGEIESESVEGERTCFIINIPAV